jgi:predicted Zn-dependent protease DUF2268
MTLKFETKFIALLLIIIFEVISCSTNPGENTRLNETVAEAEKLDDDLQVIDISQKQLALYNKHLNTDSTTRVQLFRDSLYYPYQEVWDGYVGRIETFDLVAEHYGIKKINELNEKNKLFYSGNKEEALLDAFFEVRTGMIKLTGHSPKGKWHILYGPALANLGGVGDGVMFIDFAFPGNKDLKSVINWFPHELNHQIYSNLSKDSVHNVLARCIDEGFAVYVNKLYWNNIAGNKNYSVAMSLNCSQTELEAAEKDWDFILPFFKEHYLSVERDIIDQFGASNIKLKENLPGAIGYFIGYKIVENYVNLHGDDSWKDIYNLSFEELLDKSEILKQ